ncbi:hypothetical protein Arub01_03330 [Actinomadura rubrobrunea]|uniref:DUF501 domain-containing protein n=1 Tax=Actinomadura rubrobrunea TaxID=115335 RepID=A0A9W6USX0_9ACTN|nr:DUF501 domain-containing protein [Actinomadura rubrobrunea]GLW62089.1 hypothetical protein Arub01_03330 [Actinomadura rubrobrunea]
MGEKTIDERDRAAVAAQLRREPRGLRRVAYRCPCGLPAVIETAPRLPDGTPFPTLFYLTCPKAASAVGTLEGSGIMRAMQGRLADDPALRAAYAAAHDDYLRRRDEAAREEGVEPLPPGTQSAGGMPERVKCLHALVAHELAVPGVNPFGREALDALPEWWRKGPCVACEPPADRRDAPRDAEERPSAQDTARDDREQDDREQDDREGREQ